MLNLFVSYGPREVKFKDEFSLLGQINCELKYATFSGKLRRQHQQDSEEKEASLILKEALEPAVRLVNNLS
jgi:exosome complex component MTR3